MIKQLKQFVGCLTTDCLSVFDHFKGLALKGLKSSTASRDKTLDSVKHLWRSFLRNLLAVSHLRKIASPQIF